MTARRQVGCALEYGHPQLYGKSGSGSILQDVTFASMVGTLAQLGMVAHYAKETLGELEELSAKTYERIQTVGQRTARLKNELNGVGKRVASLTDAELSLESVKRAGTSDKTPERVEFSNDSISVGMRERYELCCEKLPNFAPIDTLKDINCRKKYSDPGFFLDEWAAAEMARIAKLKEDKAQERLQKQKKRQQKKKRLQDVPKKRESVKEHAGLDWRARYNVSDDVDPGVLRRGSVGATPSRVATDHDVTVEQAQRPTSLKRTNSKDASPKTTPGSSLKNLIRTSPVKEAPSQKPQPPPPMPVQPRTQKPPPMPPQLGASSQQKKTQPSTLPPPMPENRTPPPLPPMSPEQALTQKPPPPMTRPPPMMPMSRPEMPQNVVTSGIYEPFSDGSRAASDDDDDDDDLAKPVENSQYAKYFAMLRMGIPKPAVEHKMRAEGLDPTVLDDDSDDDDQDSQVPPPVPKVGAEQEDKPVIAPPPQRPALAGGLLGAIQAGASLKKPDATPAKAAPKNDLLAAIRSGASGLREAPAQAPKPAVVSAGVGGLLGNEVDKILALRSKIEMSDSESDDDDDWDDDDDD